MHKFTDNNSLISSAFASLGIISRAIAELQNYADAAELRTAQTRTYGVILNLELFSKRTHQSRNVESFGRSALVETINFHLDNLRDVLNELANRSPFNRTLSGAILLRIGIKSAMLEYSRRSGHRQGKKPQKQTVTIY